MARGAVVGPHVVADRRARSAPDAVVGPFAYLRPGTVLEDGARVGRFVELKNTRLGARSKVPHLSYLGDAEIGEDTNIGAGNITANYDGSAQAPDGRSGAGCTTSSDTVFVAPVDGRATTPYVGAGSVITDDVPPGALGHRAAPPDQHRGLRRASREEADYVSESTTSLLGPELATPRGRERRTPRRERRRRTTGENTRRMMLFAGPLEPPTWPRRSPTSSGMKLGRIRLKTFSDGEIYVRYDESIRGSDVFLVQSGSAPVNRNLMELLIMVQRAKLASAKRITVVMPWYPYSRQDKKSLAARADHGAPGGRPARRSPAPTGCSRWTCTPARCRASSTSRSTT